MKTTVITCDVCGKPLAEKDKAEGWTIECPQGREDADTLISINDIHQSCSMIIYTKFREALIKVAQMNCASDYLLQQGLIKHSIKL